MSEPENNLCWKLVPKIKVIACTCKVLGPEAYPWIQKNVQGPYWRIYWNDSDASFVSCQGRKVELTPKKIVVLAPDAVYSTRAERETRHFYIHCSVDYPFEEIRGRIFVLKNQDLLKQASVLAAKTDKCRSDWRAQMELMVYLNSVFLAIPSKYLTAKREYSPRIMKAIGLLKKNQKITNSQLAAYVNMSRNAFLFLFKKETKTSPQAYSINFRINEACIMLHHSDKSIDEIAQECSFCDRYHFSRVFRRKTGCSPGKFRLKRYPEPVSVKHNV